ncbi:methyl-CpG-binding domain protein 2 isoform X1 [Trichogramma pretiosum]|nr:methyl-CpG-binding domain protein 2 isoform X1 [Trichogramma pretiosum]XP_014222303.1 methyl-CpG-binding domain protein 2 isoform X1 [Trichogramma pretiosum]
MNMSIDKKKYYGQAAMPYWNQREEHQIPRKSNNNQPQQQQQQQQQAPLATAPQQLTTASKDPYYYSRPVKQDVSLLAPIRQTASIFKQPVTIIKNHKSVVKDPPTRLNEKDKPKQLFWEKRLEGLRACDSKGYELSRMELPKVLKPIGPYVSEETVLQSVATALHVGSGPVTGQTALKAQLEKNPGSFLNPDQPLLQAVTITDEDIKKQEEKVLAARQRLQEVLRY